MSHRDGHLTLGGVSYLSRMRAVEVTIVERVVVLVVNGPNQVCRRFGQRDKETTGGYKGGPY